MPKDARARALTWLAVVALGAVAGRLYAQLAYAAAPADVMSTLPGVRAGVLIAGVSAAFELFVAPGAIGRWLRARPFLGALALRVLIHTAIVVAGLTLNRVLSAWLIGRYLRDSFTAPEFLQDVVFAFLVTAAALFVLQMRALIGGRTLLNVILGRYHRPVREERIFVFMDLVKSTPLAERLGAERYHSFIAAVFRELDGAVTRSGGEIYAYLGDGVISSWPLSTPDRNAAAVEAVFATADRLRARSDWFRARFQATPTIRASLHGGAVVAGECGDSRRQIAYLGDALNVAARLEALSKTLDAAFLVSGPMLARIALPAGVVATDRGAHRLKGVAAPMPVAALERPPAPQSGGTAPGAAQPSS
ncbi:MAG: adenylate/guanylate cyclase domain-containing protein [Pseudomonadota bacterium]